MENYLYFLVSGIASLFLITPTNEYTLRFNFPGMFFNAYSSFFNRQPSIYSVEAIADIRFCRMRFDQLENLYQVSATATIIGKRAQEYFYMLKEKRELSLISKTATENFRALEKEQPDLIKLIRQKFLASYLGITPQSLSRINRTFKPRG